MKARIPLSLFRSSNHPWSAVVSYVAMVLLIAISIGGLRVWFRTDLSYSTRAGRLLEVLLSVLFLAGVTFLIEHVTRLLLSSDVLATRDRLRMAMICGKSVGWESDVAAGRLEWFGDLGDIFGINSDTFIAAPEDFYRYVHPEDRERVSQAVANARDKHTPYTTEFRIVRKDGMTVWVSANGKFYYSESGAPRRMLGIAVDITDRKKVEEALSKSEEKFSKAFRESPVAITLTSAHDHRYLDINDTFERISGWTRDEIIGRTPFDIGIWANPAERELLVKEVLAKHPVRNLEVRFRIKDGSERVGLGSAEAIELDNELCILSAIADITDRKRAEEALRKKESELAEAQRTAHVGSWQWNPETGELSWSDELYALFGLDPKLPPPSIADLAGFFTTDQWERLEQTMTEAAQNGCVKDIDAELTRGDGSKRWINARGQSVRDQDGKLVCFAGTAQDITDRMHAQNALLEGEERFRLVANSAPVMVWMSGTDGLCNYFNNQWLDFTGRPLEAEIGDGWAQNVHPDELNRCLSIYMEAFDRRERFDMEYRLQRRDGEYRWIYDIGVPRFNPDGSFAGYIGSAIDVSEQKKAQEVLSNIGQKLIEAHEQERTWISRELHDDINQRLALAAVELDRAIQRLPASATDVHLQVQRAHDRINEISNDIQALSHRLHSSKLEYLGLVAAANGFCKEVAERNGVRIHFSQTGIPRILPKEISVALFRVMQEALQNAVKHSGAHEFRVELRGASNTISLKVSDSGKGFKDENAAASKGLGLISMRERMNLVRGTFSIHSQPDVGTTVCAQVRFVAAEQYAIAG